jgi:hypothetical protein
MTAREARTKSCAFVQNKPNFQKAQMNVKSFHATDYDGSCRFEQRKNKPNSKPITGLWVEA